MAVKAKYGKPLQVVEEAVMVDRIRAIADAEDVSVARVIRQLTAHGIEWRERMSQERDERLGEYLLLRQ